MAATMSLSQRTLNLRLDLQSHALNTLSSLSRRFGADRTRPPHLLTGERGELEALFYLRRRGYIVIARRWRTPELHGDLDIVAWHPSAQGLTLCFVEVKTRSARDQTPAALAIDRAKRLMLTRMARAFLRTLPRPRRQNTAQPIPARFDIVSVYLLPTGPQCELLQDAFPPEQAQSRRFGV